MSDEEESLDPRDWDDTRRRAHRMVDDAIDYLSTVRDRPVWQPMPDAVKAVFDAPLPQAPGDADAIYRSLMENVMAYPMGNIHPRFWMWYMGSSNFTGAMGDFWAAINGSNLGGGNHAAALVDRQVVDWCKQMLGLPDTASGTLVSGGSMANIIGLAVARNAMADVDLRTLGVAAQQAPLRFYGSDQLHSCHQKAMELMGLGSRALVKVASNDDFEMDLAALAGAVARDRAEGLKPACVIATAGTVNTGAIDDLRAVADFCEAEGLWFHVDGCIGALIAIAPENRHRVAGIERADSVAMDPHKWLHAPFEVGCALLRDRAAHRGTFSVTPEYLETMARGIAAAEMLHDYGMQTSRGFRALKVWLSLQEHGVRKFGRLVDRNIAQGALLARLVEDAPALALVAPANINIVCYRYDPGGMAEDRLKALNTEIMLRLQESGVAAVSDTTVHGRHCLRAAINNHRTQDADLELLVAETVRLGDLLAPGFA